MLERLLAAVVIADSNHIRHVINEYLAVANFSGAGRAGETLDYFFRPVVCNHDLYFDLGQKVDGVLHPAIDLLVPFLPAMATYFADTHPMNADRDQSVFYGVELEWLDYCFYLFQLVSLWLSDGGPNYFLGPKNAINASVTVL